VIAEIVNDTENLEEEARFEIEPSELDDATMRNR
jgi:hypothetical protein